MKNSVLQTIWPHNSFLLYPLACSNAQNIIVHLVCILEFMTAWLMLRLLLLLLKNLATPTTSKLVVLVLLATTRTPPCAVLAEKL